MNTIHRYSLFERKIIPVFILLLWIAGQLWAGPVDSNRAKQVAASFISTPSSLRSNNELSLIYTATNDLVPGLRSENYPLYYIYNVAGQRGFVIVAADDRVMPVLGYADTGSFQTEDMPENVKSWLNLYKEEIVWAIENKQEAGEETIRAWYTLLSGTTTKATTALLLPTAHWDQGTPFNDLCPLKGQTRTVTGCVATAVGIIMKYHNWPKKGTGRITYTSTTESLGVSADLNTAYDWQNMPDINISNSYSPTNWTAEQRKAVATLLFHCGAASRMDYGIKASGTDTRLAKQALIDHFGYDNGMCYTRKNFYTNDEWHAMIRKELEENRPILYGGQTKTKKEGHQFIIDGFNAQDYYHVNWGWGGLANGYYLLSSLQPTWQGIGGSTSGSAFSTEQDMLIGFEKAKEGSLPGYEFYFYLQGPYNTFGLQTSVKEIRPGEQFDLGISYILDAGRRHFKGYLAFFVVDKKGNRKEHLGGFQAEISPEHPVTFDLSDKKYTIKNPVEEGDKIQLFFSVDTKNWKAFRGDKRLAVTELPIGQPIHSGNNSFERNENITIYPTATESVLYIESENNTEIRQAHIYNTGGRLLKSLKINATDTRIPLRIDDLSSGLYILSLQTSKGTHSYKIIRK